MLWPALTMQMAYAGTLRIRFSLPPARTDARHNLASQLTSELLLLNQSH